MSVRFARPFEASEHDDPFAMLPEGIYRLRCEDSEKRKTKANDEMLVLHFKVTEGAYKGKSTQVMLNLWNSSAQAREIAAGELSAICQAMGVPRIVDTAELHSKEAEVGVEHDGDYVRYRGWKPVPPGRAGASSEPPLSEPEDDSLPF